MLSRVITAGIAALAGAAIQASACFAADDPYVQLDEAKLVLGQGKLTQAAEMFSAIPTVGVEEYVVEELVYQQLLVSAAYLIATHYLLDELKANDLRDSEYGDWLSDERASYARAFEHHAADYLTRTADSPQLEFVRFRLPRVTDDYLMDAGLYSDEPVLSAACTNWEDGRDGLGRGIIHAQARVALVLSAAVHYDLAEASSTLEAVARRLRGGVPIDELILLDWLADTASRLAIPGEKTEAIARRANQRIMKLTADDPDHPLRERAIQRTPENDEADSSSQ